MKKLILAITGLLISANVFAQEQKTDSLIALLKSTREDVERLKVLKQLVNYDIALPAIVEYSQEGLNLAKKMNSQADEEIFLLALTHGYDKNYNYPEVLETSIQGIALSEKLNDKVYQCWFLNSLALGYNSGNERVKAVSYALQGLHIAQHIKDQKRIAQLAYNLSEFYIEENRLDSALFYMEVSYSAEALSNDPYIGYPIRGLGDIESKMGHPTLALSHYRAAIIKCIQGDNPINEKNLTELYENIANIQNKLGNTDSALFYANKSYLLGERIDDRKAIYESALTLSALYDSKDQLKSLRFYKISAIAHDSLLNEEKIKQFQIITANQQHKESELKTAQIAYKNRLRIYGLLGILGVALLISGILWNNNKKQQDSNKLLLKQQNELKQTQAQLIQAEKMASLGELTAGIAHEIQNPLNFVNNFSDVNKELIDEMQLEIAKGDLGEIKALANDISENEQKINLHGKRADAIVKGMLQHSQTGKGTKELTDINSLAEERLRLAYHTMQSKNVDFHAEVSTSFDVGLPMISVIPQDIGKVLLNVFNNAFYALNQRRKTAGADYKPEVSVTTSVENKQVVIKVKDNGNGIPENIKEKIMQPFFTTKPTGEGTGLGLSLSYDMVVKGHGGIIAVTSKEGEGSEFTISLPTS